MDSCDENFVFKTTHEKMAAATERELRGEVIGNIKTYQAVCLKCNKKILMSQKNMNKWRKIFTGGEVEIATTKFNDLFDEG